MSCFGNPRQRRRKVNEVRTLTIMRKKTSTCVTAIRIEGGKVNSYGLANEEQIPEKMDEVK